MPREWPFGGRSSGSPPKCASDEPAGVPADLSAAFVDRAPIDWQALRRLTRGRRGRSVLENLHFLESIRKPSDASPSPVAPRWPIVSARLVFTLAALQTTCGLTILAIWVATGGPLERVPRVAIAVAFALGSLLLATVSRDERRVFLVAAFACAASAFTRSALVPLPVDRVAPIGLLFRGLVMEAFVPAALWHFALLFPQVRRFTAFDLAARRVAVVMSGVALFLFTANLAEAYPPGIALAAILDREHPLRLFWHIFVVGSLSAIATVFVRARRAPFVERRKIAHLAMALGLGTGPLFLMGLARMTVPAVERWIREIDPAGRAWLDTVIVAGLTATPILSTLAIVADRPFDGPSILLENWRDRAARSGLTLVIAAPFVALAVTLYRLRQVPIADALSLSHAWIPLACVSAVCLLMLARRWGRRVVDENGRRRFASAHEELTAALERVRFARGAREAARALVRELQAELQVDRVRLFVRARDDRFVDTLDEGPALRGDGALIAVFGELTRPLDVQESSIQPLLPDADIQWIAGHDVRMAIALKRRDGTIVAVASVSSKRNGQRFTRRDRWFASTLATAAAGAWEGESGARARDDGQRRREAEPAFECPRCGWISSSTPLLCRCRAGATLAALPHRLAGKFLVERRLGAGGMGVVYLARDVSLDRDVALKTLPELRGGSVERLRREARAMASLNHDALATLYGLERWRRTPVLVVEYFPDGTLANRLRHGPLPHAASIAVGVRLAAALEYMHANGVLHRDLKPSNIGLTPSGAAKLLDFGLATLIDGIPDYRIAGTPAYLPPEAYAGSHADASFDLWALAIVLFEAMTAQHPFAARARRPFDRRRLISPATIAFFERAFSARPEERFASARELRSALEALLERHSR